MAALAATLAALFLAAVGAVDPGVIAENPGGVVRWVDPGGPAWVSGLRDGQLVLAITAADEPTGWAVETSDGAERHRFSALVAEAALRTTLPIVGAGVAAAAIAVAISRTRRRRSELLASASIALASTPYLIAEPGPVGMATVVGSIVLPAVWLARWRDPGRGSVVGLVGLAVVAGVVWVALEQADAPIGALAGSLHVAALVVATVVVMIGAGATPRRLLAALSSTRTLDVLVVTAAVVLAITLAAAGLAPLVIGLLVLVPLAGYARSRSAIARLADRLLLSELREREALRATEEERARISREIHDDSLQAIAGVIAQLEDPTGDRGVARDSLRTVADHLRQMATELHPPVLDDLGLAPAIEFAARGAPQRVSVAIANHVGYGRVERPPAEVELAVYRIAAEAIANASHHADAAHVAVSGTIDADEIEVHVADDGCGVEVSRIDDAMRDGRMGIASMRRRAAAIDADLSIETRPAGGTEVVIRWTA